MSRLKRLRQVLANMSPEHRKQVLAILKENPSLTDGFLDRITRKQTGDSAAVVRLERAVVASFLDQLKTDTLRKKLKQMI